MTSQFDIQRANQWLSSAVPEYLKDLERLVSIDSGTYDKAGADDVVSSLEGLYVALGAAVERRTNDVYGDTLIATLEAGGRGRVLLIGHTDTVYPAGTVADRPMRREGNRIIGPGTADMKAGDLSIVYALRALREQGAQLPGRVTVIHNSDEEIGSPSSRALIRKAATEADATLVLEAGRENGDVVIARKGIADIRVRVQGQAAHAGVNHDRGRSAVLSLARIVTSVESLNGTLPGVTLNVGQIEGGGRVNVVPDHASARLEVRAFERSLLESMLGRVEHAIQGAVIDGTVAETDVSIEHWPMPRSEGGTRLFETARRLGETLGERLNGAQTGGASDGNTAADAGCPVLDGLGPVGGNTHSPSEYVLADSIAPRTAILAGLVSSIGNQPLPGVQ